MSLAHAGRSQQQDVAGLGDEGQVGQFPDMPLVDGGLEGEVELVQGTLEGQVGHLGLGSQVALPPSSHFHPQQVGQHLRVGQLLVGGGVQGVVRGLDGLFQSRGLSRAIADAGMSGFLSKLEYKCAWYGAEYVKADRWYASSKLCAHCGWKNDVLALSDREWWCAGCGTLNDRDANAAVNLAMWPGLSFPVSGRGDRVRPATLAVACEASSDSRGEVWSPANLKCQISSDSE